LKVVVRYATASSLTMSSAFDDVLRLYDYELPPELIARTPAHPRDAARLLVYDRSTSRTVESTCVQIGEFLPEGCLLVLNETRVIPAKFQGVRSTGGRVTFLYLGAHGRSIRAFANRRLKLGEVVRLSGGMSVEVTHNDGKDWILRPSASVKQFQLFLERSGCAPLPPYIKHSPLTERQLRREYQSVFAKQRGSVAAPTASLHFTKRLLGALERRGIRIAKVTLHVHLGTFAPLTEAQWSAGSLHSEHFSIPHRTKVLLEQAKRSGGAVIAVGTTVVRTLESASDDHGNIVRTSGETNLFIRDGYRFHMVDGLLTNFHVPRSSLLMLVGAFIGRTHLLSLYHRAIRSKFRFFSFGDAMLIL
jgi:S-adenosylmethionine:tRNA ribosyltransferase-isomerase